MDKPLKMLIDSIRKNSFVSDSGTYLFSNILYAAIPFLLLPVLTRYLTVAEYGEVAMFQALVAFFSVFTGLSVHGSASRKYYDKALSERDLKQYIGVCLQVLIFSGTLVLVLIWLNGDQVVTWTGLPFIWILWGVFVSASIFVVHIRLGQWLIRKKSRYYGTLQVSQALIEMALSVIFVMALSAGSEGRVTAYIITSILFLLVSLWLLWRDKLLSFFVWRPDFAREVLAFGIPLIPHVTGLFLLNTFDRFFIGYSLGLAEAGIYMVAVQFSMALGIIFDSVNKAYVPRLYEILSRGVASEKQRIVFSTYIYFAFTIFLAAVLTILGPSLVVIVAGEKYSESGQLIGWLALGRAFGGMYLMVTNYIFYSKRTGLLSLATIVSSGLYLVLLTILLPGIGLKGAAIAYAIAMGVRFFLTWCVAQIRHPMPWFTFSVIKTK